MMKTLRSRLKQEKEKFKIPRKVQHVIPIQTIWKDGIFLVGKNLYAKSYQFTDINYAVASPEDKQSMLIRHSDILNFLDSEASTKITIAIRKINQKEFEELVLIPKAEDGLDCYREEYNRVILEQVSKANGMIRELYITTTIYRNHIEEARSYFNRVAEDLIDHFANIGSICLELDGVARLRILHDFYRAGEETDFQFDLEQNARLGHDFKDYICPDGFEFEKDYFKMGERYGRVLYLKDYASYIRDNMLTSFGDINQQMMISTNIISIPTDEAIREVQNRLLGIETNITTWQRKQNENNNFSATVPYDMELQRKEAKEFMHDLTVRDQRMNLAVVTIVHTADSLEQLDLDTNTLLTKARNGLCQFAVLKYQQMDGLNTALPIGVRRINAIRTLTTESLTSLMPFQAQEVLHPGGIYSGINAISGNLIMINRSMLLNPSSFVLEIPGSGKSMYVKMLIVFLVLATKDQILVYDPEGEVRQEVA